jgi:RNA polymerase sigma-70 factor (ECF subfamily)
VLDLERQVRELREGGDLAAAATTAIKGYGPEVLGFLVTLLRDENDASEVFSQACEDLWIGLPRFEARSSLRTWFYTLARNAASRLRRSPHRRADRRGTLAELIDVAERVRTATLPHLRTDVKDRVATIRDALPPDDRALLVLRLDREMSWGEIARVFSPEDASETTLARVAARLRKRFQLVKDDIRARARESGLLPDNSP